MSKEDTAIGFHDLVVDLLLDLSTESDDEIDDVLREDMGNLTDILFDTLNFEVTGDGVAEIRLS